MIKEKRKGFGKETFEEEILKDEAGKDSHEEPQNDSANQADGAEQAGGADQTKGKGQNDREDQTNSGANQTSEGPKDSEDPKDSEEQTNAGDQAEASKENEDFKNQYVRLMADFQNFRKRTEKEKSDIYAYANEKIVVDLLSVIDNFERAIDAAEKNEGADASFVEGMKMILKQMLDVLRKHDVKEIEAVGQDFDPNFHNAVMMEDNPDFESGKVTEVLQKGYMLNDRVIRPSMVKVAN